MIPLTRIHSSLSSWFRIQQGKNLSINRGRFVAIAQFRTRSQVAQMSLKGGLGRGNSVQFPLALTLPTAFCRGRGTADTTFRTSAIVARSHAIVSERTTTANSIKSHLSLL